MNEQKMFGVVIFTWDEWDEIETGCLQFYAVNFPFESMKKYNGMDASLDMDGELRITEKTESARKYGKVMYLKSQSLWRRLQNNQIKEREE